MTNQALAFSGPQIGIFRARVLCKAIEIYAKHGLRVNTAYSPRNMLRTASQITGKTYKTRQYDKAIKDLNLWIKTQREQV